MRSPGTPVVENSRIVHIATEVYVFEPRIVLLVRVHMNTALSISADK